MLRGLKTYHLRFVLVMSGFVIPWVISTISIAYAASNSSSSGSGIASPMSAVTAVVNLVLALGVVGLLAVLSIRFLAKRANVQQKGSITVLAARQLAPNRSIQVVEVQGKRYLLGVGEQITLLADVSETYVVDGESVNDLASGQAFGQLLSDALSNIRERYRNASEEDKE